MGKATGFLEHSRKMPGYEPVQERVENYKEFIKDNEFGGEIINQASRCMDCGTPFCHSGCPLGNIIPEFNDAVYNKDWADAYEILTSTNNFPEMTGRICPAPCEHACVLGINQPPITIENIEKNIIEYAFSNGLVKPRIPTERTGKKVAVVGSGPAGMAVADQLNSAGHSVTVFERASAIGGLLRFGIPDFKLEKSIIERRVAVMEQSGIEFKINADVGKNIKVSELEDKYDSIVIATGSTVPRDLPVPNRDAEGIYFAMDFLSRNSARVQGKQTPAPFDGETIWATDKNVIVIGGGDTGSDCIGTSNRHKAKSITQFEIMPKPPAERNESMPWPNYAMVLKTTSSHEEGVDRHWSIMTKEFIKDDEGKLKGLKTVDVEWEGRNLKEVEGSERTWDCELALLAMGFLHPQHEGLLNDLGVELDQRGNVSDAKAPYQTSKNSVFVCGDARRGQSLVVWAISEGRECAVEVDKFLRGGKSKLEQKANSFLFNCSK